MGQTYRATGINLKAMALGENDRLLTILTKERGLVRVVATGARKHRSNMAGRSGLFVVNDMLIACGRTLDRIRQAETLQSFVGLGQNLAKLTSAQYLAELVLVQALSAQPQEELFLLLTEHLTRLQQTTDVRGAMACLSHGIYHLLAIAGIAPQVHICCLTRKPITPNFIAAKWQAGFSTVSGGVVDLSSAIDPEEVRVSHYLNATELRALQQLAQADLADGSDIHIGSWLAVERLLRAYAQYHFDNPIQSAALIDNCFTL